MAKSGPANVWSFLTQGRESNTLKRTTADQADDGFAVLPNAGKDACSTEQVRHGESVLWRTGCLCYVRLPAKMEMRFANALDGSA